MNTATAPIHPGEELWADWLDPLDVTVGQAATAIGVSRKTLSLIIHGHQRITAEMSVRLSKALGTAPDLWARKQLVFDLSEVDPRTLGVKRLTPRGFRHEGEK